MCGILGAIDCSFGEKELDLIKHRGPDDWGIEHYNVCGHPITLGHRRLSIVDLSPAGHQPMSTCQGKHHIVFNGEIYNHADIRKTLRQNVFRGHSDTETILYALKETGSAQFDNTLKSFNGIFGFAFLDEEKHKLYIVRDPFGVKPVYYRFSNGKLIFSSEIKPLLLGHNVDVDIDNLSMLLQLRYLPSPETLFADVKKIVPGSYLEIDLEKKGLKIEEKSYLSSLPAITQYSWPDALQLYGEKLQKAIKRQLMSDVEVGVLLSGGVDSAMVTKIAADQSGRKLNCFTVGFEGDNFEDEIEDAAETAKYLNLDHHVVRINDNDFFSKIADTVSIIEEPLATTSVLPMMTLSELASQHVKVVLTGQGADEPLGGYGRYQSEILRHNPFVKSVVPLLKLFSWLPIRNQTLARGSRTLPIDNELNRFLMAYEVFGHSQIQQLIGSYSNNVEYSFEAMYAKLQCDNWSVPAARMMALDARMNLSDDLLLYTDKITMHYSLECRVPLLDHELVSFIESLPIEYKVKLRQGKIIHKKYAETILPTSIVNRRKKGFQSPTNKWFRKTDLLYDIFHDSSSKFSQYFNVKTVDNLLNQHKSGYNFERHIFLLLCIKFWMDKFLH